MIWIMLGYFLATMSGDNYYPFHGPAIIQEARAGFDEVILDQDRKNEIFSLLNQIEKDVEEGNKRLLEPLKTADKLIVKGKIERHALEPLYLDFSDNYIHDIRKNTKAFLELKKKVSREEWEQAFQKIMSEMEPSVKMKEK